ncbi:MAG: DNA gyrase inhibitor YacG [Deltaproteobacteria bacterium]|nr:MAG: DNA gyrase inhibitor YacG [Deltaproteobacteria bacterium]
MRCPLCGKPTRWTANPFRPFCSERCKLIDLGKWMMEEYRIEGDPRSGDRGDGQETLP